MKLIDILETAKPKVDWNYKSEAEQCAYVKKSYEGITKIKKPSVAVMIASVTAWASAIDLIVNKLGIQPPDEVWLALFKNKPGTGYMISKSLTVPSEEVQLAAVKNYGRSILEIQEMVPHPSKEVIGTAFSEPKFMATTGYPDVVRKFFKDNTILVNKWLRYRDNMRDMK
jgi:hypothetical protein